MSPTYQGYERTNSTIDIFNGDFVILQKKTPQIGDVILFKPLNQNKYYFHRIIAKEVIHNETFYLTKGDDNRYTDISTIGDTNFGWIPQENVLGVAVFTIHWIGWFIKEMSSLNFLIPFLAILVLLGIVYRASNHEKATSNSKKQSKHIKKQLAFKKWIIPINKTRIRMMLLLGLLGLIVLPALTIELLNVQANPISVQLLQTNNDPLPNYINLDNPHLFDLENIQYNGQTLYALNIKLQLTSGGLFNSLTNVKIQLFNNSLEDNPIYYRWGTTGQFAGTITVGGVLFIPLNLLNGQNNASLMIDIDITVSHIVYQDHQIRNQAIIL